jgi:transcriptional regulator with XRE-family HTH domain
MKDRQANPNINVIREFAANLQKAVDATGLTPYTLARNIGLDKDAIKNLLKGARDPKFSTIIHLAKGMPISLDQLLGMIPAEQKSESKIEIKKEFLNLADRISTLHKQDVELLETIIGVLETRKARSMTRFLKAVREPEQPKENEMAITTEKVMEPQVSVSSFDDDFDDDDFDEDRDDSEDSDEDSDSEDYDEDDYDDEDEDYDEGEDPDYSDDDDIDYDDLD